MPTIEQPDLPLVLVQWNDAWGEAEAPVTLADVAVSHRPTVIHTLGWVLLDDERGLSLANEYYLDTYRGRTFIPRELITSVVTFGLTRKRKKR